MRKHEKKQPPSWLIEKDVDAIFCADLHLRDKRPVGRNDDWRSTMIEKLIWIRQLQEEFGGCEVFAAGDIFDHWKASPDLLTIAEKFLPSPFVAIPGQHDLPLHSFDQFSKSALYHLYANGRVEIPLPEYIGSRECYGREGRDFYVHGFEFGKELYTPEGMDTANFYHVALVHQFAYRGRRPWPGCEAEGLRSISEKLKGFDLVVIGDNHKPFTYKDRKTGQLIVNCGSMMRTTADQIDYRPRVWAWNCDGGVWPLYIPIKEDAISREHLERIEIRNERIDAFIQRLSGDFDAGMSFLYNLNNFFRSNDVRPIVKRKIHFAIGEGSNE